MSITLYGRHTSYNVQKVLWFLDQLELDYQHIELGSSPGDTETKEFGKLNPMRKVPVLADDEKIIWESNSILRYLASSYGSNQWLPQDAYQRSLVERWMDWSQTRFEPAFVGVFWGYYRTPKALRNMEAINKSLDDCVYCLDRLDEQLGDQEYLLGDTLSMADITAGIFLYRLVEIDLDISLPACVARWYQELQKFPGYKRWPMSDFSSLLGRLAY